MTEDKSEFEQKKQRKTLGLTKKLGVKLPNKKLITKDFLLTKNSGTVVVVTKRKSSNVIDKKLSSDSVGKLTDQEKQNRLNALLNAEKGDKTSFDSIVNKSNEEIVSENKAESANHTKDVEITEEKSQKSDEQSNKNGSKINSLKKKFEKKVEFIDKYEEKKDNKKRRILIENENEKDVKKAVLKAEYDNEGAGVNVETKIKTIKRLSKVRYKDKKAQKQKKIYMEVKIPEQISVQELASRMTEKISLVIKTLADLGISATVNQDIDSDTAALIVQELGHVPIMMTDADMEKKLFKQEKDSEDLLKARAPIVTVMGHVDHGKTSLLDALRSADIAKNEHGGITQHIGAYNVCLAGGSSITFLDTPGHAAFTAMRMRGAKITDVVVIVVAADDGIKEQTVEAINHAKAAEVPIIVAINKIDKPDANVDKVKNSLLNYELIPDDMGGDVMVIPISAKEKKGLDALKEAILVHAELLNLRANPNKNADGVVIESKIDKTKGIIATLLIHGGTLKIGDIVVIDCTYFKVRALIDDMGKQIKESGPSTPTEVLGLTKIPNVGEKFIVVENEKSAKKIVEFQEYKNNKNIAKNTQAPSLDALLTNKLNTNLKTLTIILKADVHGSLEAINDSLETLSTNEVKLKITHFAVGNITESDILLAKVTGAVIIGFNVKADNKAIKLQKTLNIQIEFYSIIYDLIDRVKAIINGLVSPIKKKKVIGYAEVRQVINLTKHNKVAGCMVTEGIIKKKAYVKLSRNNVVLHEGKPGTLKRFKDDVKEVRSGFECGISFEKFSDIEKDDLLEFYEIVEEKDTINNQV